MEFFLPAFFIIRSLGAFTGLGSSFISGYCWRDDCPLMFPSYLPIFQKVSEEHFVM